MFEMIVVKIIFYLEVFGNDIYFIFFKIIFNISTLKRYKKIYKNYILIKKI